MPATIELPGWGEGLAVLSTEPDGLRKLIRLDSLKLGPAGGLLVKLAAYN